MAELDFVYLYDSSVFSTSNLFFIGFVKLPTMFTITVPNAIILTLQVIELVEFMVLGPFPP